MKEKDFQKILLNARSQVLNRMKEKGFFYKEEEGVRYDPILWDINNGWCEEFAILVEKSVPFPETECLWLDDILPDAGSHCVISWRQKYYDAECIDGVKSLRKLPIMTRKPNTREAFIENLVSVLEI
jgi:hypothetical protein